MILINPISTKIKKKRHKKALNLETIKIEKTH